MLQGRNPATEAGQLGLAAIILNQPLKDLFTLNRIWKSTSLRVAADGGANRLLWAQKLAGQHPSDEVSSLKKPFDGLDVVIGDLDSLTNTTRAHFQALGTEIVHDKDQDSTDFGKAVRLIKDRTKITPLDIVVMGGLGGRVDQGMSQVHHLYLFQQGTGYEEGKIYLVSGESLTFVLKAGHHRIHVCEQGEQVFGKYVGILPIGGTSIITTKGLEWDIENWETRFGGQISTSNHILPDTKVLHITTSSDVVFTIALKDRGFGTNE